MYGSCDSSSPPACKTPTCSVARGTSLQSSFKSHSSIHSSVSFLPTKNVSVSSINDSPSNTKVTHKAGTPRLSYAEVGKVTSPYTTIRTTLSTSPKNTNKISKSESLRSCSGVSAGHHLGQVAQTAFTRVVTPCIFLPTQNPLLVNPIIASRDNVCLSAVPPRKAIFVLLLVPDCHSFYLKGVSNFKFFSIST